MSLPVVENVCTPSDLVPSHLEASSSHLVNIFFFSEDFLLWVTMARRSSAGPPAAATARGVHGRRTLHRDQRDTGNVRARFSPTSSIKQDIHPRAFSFELNFFSQEIAFLSLDFQIRKVRCKMLMSSQNPRLIRSIVTKKKTSILKNDWNDFSYST